MVYNKVCLKNLKHLKPGHEPLPGAGRPEGSVSIVSALKAHLRQHPETIATVVQDWLAGVKDQPALLKELLDRTDGKVPQPVSGELTGNLTVNVVSKIPRPGRELP